MLNGSSCPMEFAGKDPFLQRHMCMWLAFMPLTLVRLFTC